MSSYFDANEVRNILLQKMAGTGYQSKALDCLLYIEPADVEPVRRAKWVPVTNAIHCDDEAWVQYQCSNCGRVIWVDHNAESLSNYPYCHCGAKMDLGDKDGSLA